MKQVYLGLGSNIPPQLGHLHKTVAALQGSFVEGFVASPIYASSPYQQMEQEVYFNMACAIQTTLPPRKLLQKLLSIETSLGRVRGDEKWGPRTIDIDILSYEDVIIDEEGLQIPHYDLANRDFFLVPLSQIAPEFKHPETEMAIAQMIAEIAPENLTDLRQVEEGKTK